MIRDSGNRREFETGAVRDIAEGKGRCDLLPLDVIADLLGDFILKCIHSFMYTGDTHHIRVAISTFINMKYDELLTLKNLKTVSKKGDIHFRYYLEYDKVNRILKDKIRKYNRDYSGRKNHQEITEYSKTWFYYLIEGFFKKKYTNVGGLKLLFIDSKDIELEKEAEKSFLEICDLCETIKLKL